MSLKMENFCRAYVLGGVARTAALEAGYSESYARCRSHELLDHMGVRLGIEALRREMQETNTGEPESGESFSYDEPRWRQRYLEVLWAIGSSSMEEMIVDGEMVEPDPGSLAWWAIKSWKQVPDGKGGMVPMIELHDKVPALREFGKATGFNAPEPVRRTRTAKWSGPSFDDKIAGAVNGCWQVSGYTPEEVAAMRQGEEGRGAAGGRAGSGSTEETDRHGNVPTDKNGGFAPMFEEAEVGEATDKCRSFVGGSEFDRKIGDRKNGQSSMPLTDREFGPQEWTRMGPRRRPITTELLHRCSRKRWLVEQPIKTELLRVRATEVLWVERPRYLTTAAAAAQAGEDASVPRDSFMAIRDDCRYLCAQDQPRRQIEKEVLWVKVTEEPQPPQRPKRPNSNGAATRNGGQECLPHLANDPTDCLDGCMAGEGRVGYGLL